MVSLETFLSELLDSIGAIGPAFVDVATRDPIAAVLVLFGGLFVLAAVGVLGVLALGAIAELVTPSRPGRSHPPEAR
ncbi:hypothetical protein [Halapricum desulfuricans]|uniref:hypothetical protein n=1 Tax=Halapricum desulfuricans TaxID=2841257 RepID=UPI001E5B8ACE|nr:hypothetical protein [Halapricum desulfuricans]